MAVTIPDIRALVAERQRFDDWLTALESRRDETPVRVFERVHADYLGRRNAVIENLHTHVGSLEAMERDLNDRLQQLDAQLAEREDERAEAMLRTAVGEYDSEQWESTRQDVEATLAQLGQNREALIIEADDVRNLLASARHRPTAPEPEPEPEPLVVASTEDTTQELVSPNIAQAIAHADPAAVEHAADLNVAGTVTEQYSLSDLPSAFVTTDPYLRAVNARAAEQAQDIESAFAVSDSELANLSGSHDRQTYGQHAADVTAAPTESEREREREADAAIDALGARTPRHSDSLEDIDVFGEPNNTPRASASTATNNTDSYTSRAATPPATNPPTPFAPPASRDGFDDLAFLRSLTDSGSGSSAGSGTTRTGGSTDQTKTLRCTECGTMNFPTEWYCERCGGELAGF